MNKRQKSIVWTVVFGLAVATAAAWMASPWGVALAVVGTPLCIWIEDDQ